MGAFLLGLDYGTGGAKATLIDDQGEEHAFAYEEYSILTPHPGWSEHDARSYWDTACRLIRRMTVESGIDSREIRGIAVSSALPSLVMVDREHKPVANAYNLLDRRATEEVKWIKELFGADTIFRISGNRLDDHPLLVNLLWEKRHRPDVYRRIWKSLTIDGYLNLKLTGRATTHFSAAAFWGVAYNIRRRCFEPDILDQMGIEAALLPDLYACDEIVGTVTAEAARATGLAVGTPVAAGQVDCNAGWVGAGAVEPGDVQMNLGTCGNFGVIHRDDAFMETMIAFAYTTDSRTTYITVPTTLTGGLCIRYLRDRFYTAELTEAESSGADVYDRINQEAEGVPPGSDGLVVLPFLMGERTPIWDAQARGVVFGLSLHHSRGHLARAMMEGVAFALYDSFVLVQEKGWKINTPLVLNEGGAKSALWRRIITDVFDLPTVLVGRRTGAPYGDAILAGVATGIFPDFSVARQWTEYVEPMEPDPDTHNRYREYFQLYKRLYDHLKSDFGELARLRTT